MSQSRWGGRSPTAEHIWFGMGGEISPQEDGQASFEKSSSEGGIPCLDSGTTSVCIGS